MFKKSVIGGVLCIHLIVIFYFWITGNTTIQVNSTAETWINIGRICGLLLVTAVLVQLLLLSRVKTINTLFQHGVSRLYKINQWITGLLLIGHIVPILIGYGIIKNVNIVTQYNAFLGFSDITQAVIATSLVFLLIAVGVMIAIKKLPYGKGILNLLTYGVILFAYAHQVRWGRDLQQNIFAAYWLSMFVLVVSIAGWKGILQPLLQKQIPILFLSPLPSEKTIDK